MLASAQAEGQELLQQSEYREIVVTARTSEESLDQGVVENTEENITLSVTDLSAAEVSPDIAYAYLANQTRLRINNGSRQPREGEPAMAEIDGVQPVLDEVRGYQVTPDFFTAMNLTVRAGSTFTEQDMANNAKVLVLGSTIAATLFEDGYALDRQVASADTIYTIVGILEESGSSADNYAYQPSILASDSTGARAFGRSGRFSSSLHFAVEDAQHLAAAADQLESWFNAQYGIDALSINVPRDEAERAIERTENMAVITLVLALSGLLIASVNVSNILYGRTLRRRKQIGILKALGASRQNIFKLFLSESGAILVIGALLGLMIATLFSSLLTASGQQGLAPLAVAVGILLSSAITLLFTLFPAMQATQVLPADAMRKE